MILATDWTAAWLMTGVGVGVVFAILIILVLVLQIFDAVVGSSGVKPLAAVYLYFNNIHDEESGKLTIHLNEHTGWHAVLNHSI